MTLILIGRYISKCVTAPSRYGYLLSCFWSIPQFRVILTLRTVEKFMSLRDNYHRNAGQRLPRSIQARFKETARTALRFVDNNRNMLNAVGGFTALAAVGTAFIGVATYFGDQSGARQS